MPNTTVTVTKCPHCDTKGTTVEAATLRALLKANYASQIAVDEQEECESGWRFCASTDCDVVYFSEQNGITFSKDQLTVEVGVKEATGERPLCYCFGHSVATIKEELQIQGSSEALEDIRAKMKNPGCSCEVTNPSGSCCLGSVTKGIETAKSELPSTSISRSSSKAETVTKVGTVLSAIMASACCWLPLVLLAVGVSGAGIAATLETYRPVFIVVTFGFLSAAFYLTYRPKKMTSEQSCCATAPTEGEDCCPPTSARRFNMMSMNKIMLWSVTVLAGVFLLFPSYVGTLFGTTGQGTVTEDMTKSTFKIEGMTCDGCVTTVTQAIRTVPGVLAVDVSYENKQAVIGTDVPVPNRAIEDALKKAGYSGEVVVPTTASTINVSTPKNVDTTNPVNFVDQSSGNEDVHRSILSIEGMTCEHCATSLQKTLTELPEVVDAIVDFKKKEAIVSTPSCCEVPRDNILNAIRNSGFSGIVKDSAEIQKLN